MAFFDLANKIEQAKRHLNFVYSICVFDFSNNPITFKSILNSRENDGYLNTYSIIMNSCLNKNQINFLEYLKNKYEIDSDTFKKIIGLDEVSPEIRSPQDYSKRDNFILLLHLCTIHNFCSCSNEQNNYIVTFAKKDFNLTLLQDISVSTHSFLTNNFGFESFNIFENKIALEIGKKFDLKLE